MIQLPLLTSSTFDLTENTGTPMPQLFRFAVLTIFLLFCGLARAQAPAANPDTLRADPAYMKLPLKEKFTKIAAAKLSPEDTQALRLEALDCRNAYCRRQGADGRMGSLRRDHQTGPTRRPARQ